jgi:hypothetical protein
MDAASTIQLVLQAATPVGVIVGFVGLIHTVDLAGLIPMVPLLATVLSMGEISKLLLKAFLGSG